MATRQPFHNHPVVKTLVALAALVSVAFVIYDHVIKPRSNGSSVDHRSNQTVTGTKNAGQLAQAGRDVTQKTTTVHGDENTDERREQQSVISPQQNWGSQNTQISGSQVDSLTINQGQKEKDPDTVEGAPEALGRMGLKFDEEGFADANRESNLDAIKLYLRGGKSANTAYSGLS